MLAVIRPALLAGRTGGLVAMKILVTGGFGVGKTTMVGSVSEIPPVSTEAHLTEASRRLDDTVPVPGKQATTVALDFGRITVDQRVVLYLFGTPGQQRFWFMWDQLARGALGAVVLADVRRLADCFAPIDYLEQAGLPYAVVVNTFDDAPVYPAEVVREALAVGRHIPILSCDARKREGAKQVLIALVEHVAVRYRRPALVGTPPGGGSSHP
jgi:signal recognition particle receptor subunit beta